jgi:hypothetical protein
MQAARCFTTSSKIAFDEVADLLAHRQRLEEQFSVLDFYPYHRSWVLLRWAEPKQQLPGISGELGSG